MQTPVAAIHPILLDAIISAAKAMEILGEEFYSGKNIAGEEHEIRRYAEPNFR